MKDRLFAIQGDPFSERARLALAHAGIEVEIFWTNSQAQDVVKAPLLQTTDETLHDSLEIMDWALDKKKESSWTDWDIDQMEDSCALIELADGPFWSYLRLSITGGEDEKKEALFMASGFLSQLEALLYETNYLLANKPLVTDFAIYPCVHYFSKIAREEWDIADWPNLKRWFEQLSQTDECENVYACR